MNFFRKPITQIIIFYFLIILVALSLTGKSLLSLPFFYNQNSYQRLVTFTIVWLASSVAVYFATRIFILGYLQRFLQWKNLVFIILLIIFLTILLGINSAHYWSFPEIHKVEICFDAQEGNGSLRINKFVEPNTNRLFPPNSFSQNKYPVQVPSGECINGKLIYLPSLLTRALIVPRLSVFVDENPPSGRFFISINGTPSVVLYNDEDETQQTKDELIITEGFNQAIPMTGPWKQYWFLGLKAMGIFFSAVFLSFFLYGLVETIITGSNDYQSNEK